MSLDLLPTKLLLSSDLSRCLLHWYERLWNLSALPGYNIASSGLTPKRDFNVTTSCAFLSTQHTCSARLGAANNNLL